MLRYSYFCRTHKGLFYCWVESGAFNLGVCPQAMHTMAAMHTEYESLGETALCGTREVHRSAEKDSEAMAKLHIPVMVDEVVHCLTPQKGQVSWLFKIILTFCWVSIHCLKIYNWVFFSVLICLWSYDYHLGWELFRTWISFIYPLARLVSYLLLSGPWKPLSYFMSFWICLKCDLCLHSFT